MTLAAVADPHIWNHKRHGGALVRGVNRRGELCLDVLQRASALAQRRDAELIVAGDLVDSAGPIQPQLAQRIRATLPEESGLVVGNHDATAADDHSLGLYAPSERIADKVRQLVAGGWLDRPLATLVPYTANIDDIRTAAPLVIGHFGIYDDSFPPYLRKRPARHVEELFTWMRDRDVRVLMCGDYHKRRIWHSNGTTPAFLDKNQQRWTYSRSVSGQGPLLDLDRSSEKRVWTLYRTGEQKEPSTIPPHHDMGEPSWFVSEGLSDRSSLLQPAMRESCPHGSGHSESEHLTGRERPSEERAQNALPAGPSVFRREYNLRQDSPYLAKMPNLSKTDAESPLVVMQIGALIATGWDNPGLYGYGTVAFWNGERLSWEELPGPRFCTVRSDEEEKAVVAEAAKLGHNLFLRRYYTGDRPETPPGLEAYEALPVAVEQAAAIQVPRTPYGLHPHTGSMLYYPTPQAALDELVSHWLDTIAPGDERAAVQEILKRYL